MRKIERTIYRCNLKILAIKWTRSFELGYMEPEEETQPCSPEWRKLASRWSGTLGPESSSSPLKDRHYYWNFHPKLFDNGPREDPFRAHSARVDGKDCRTIVRTRCRWAPEWPMHHQLTQGWSRLCSELSGTESLFQQAEKWNKPSLCWVTGVDRSRRGRCRDTR